MHSKHKGNIGETAIALDLMKKGYAVFTEMGDLSRIDLIAIKDDKCHKIQVKYITAKRGAVEVSRIKSAKGYSFKYQESDFDYIAVYVPDIEKVAYVSSSELCNVECSMTLRLEPPKNNQMTGVRMFNDYQTL